MNRALITTPLRHDQRGISLLVALVFLLVLAMLGIGAMQSNMMQERMSGNTRNRDLAFQAAESALRNGEAALKTMTTAELATIPAHDASLGNDADYWTSTADWSDGTCTASSTTCRTTSVSLGGVNAQPRYHLERMPDIGSKQYYRITARGLGQDTDTVVILQSIVEQIP